MGRFVPVEPVLVILRLAQADPVSQTLRAGGTAVILAKMVK